MFKLKPMRCIVCTKIVGWAEAVHRDDKVFHRDCFKCGGCSKKLARGQGLRKGDDYFCNNCHGKDMGPMGFSKGVVKKKEVMHRVQMNMQPRFAHVSTRFQKENKSTEGEPWWKGTGATKTNDDSGAKKKKKKKAKEETPPEGDMIHEFDVAIYEGDTVEELKEYLTNGNVDHSNWGTTILRELQEQVDSGKCEVGLDVDGTALRVASVAKVFVYDEHNDLLLFNPVNSFESHTFTKPTKSAQMLKMSPFQQAVGDAQGIKIEGHKPKARNYNGKGGNRVYGNNNKKKSENVEIPSCMVFETTFSPFKETPRDAAARVCSWRFSLKMMTGRVFSKVIPMKEKVYESTHFPGLKSEYHVHHVRINPEFIVPMQKALPVDSVSPVVLKQVTNTGVNTHWYCWIKASDAPSAMVNNLSALYGKSEKVKSLVGDADFSGDMAKAIGKFMKEEADLLGLWN